MKLCKLKLKNLNSFRKEIEIDFTKSPLDDASLVAITGPTGAGKTTLLDAVCVALYGKTPRLSGTGSQNPNHLISHGEREGSAEVHFMANGTRYIATWSIKRGSAAKVRLSYAADGKLISDRLSRKGKALGPSRKTVSEEVESILGLDFGAFRRSVMLAQGEFAAFLKASSEERRKILEATAGIGIYVVLKEVLNQKVNEVEAANAEVLDRLKQIPEASHAEIAAAETELNGLEAADKALNTQSQHAQQEKERETQRTADYEKLRASKARQTELSDLQPEIDALQTKRENAERAERLRSEKLTFGTAKSELEKAADSRRIARTEKTEAEKQVAADQADFDEKAAAYQSISNESDRKMPVYNAAKLDVERASDQFAEADNRTPQLTDVAGQIDALSNELSDKGNKQARLQKGIDKARRFLDENPLPSDRQSRLNRAGVLLAHLDAQGQQSEATLESQGDFAKQISSLKSKLEALARDREERLAEKRDAGQRLEIATTDLDRLLATGTQEVWTARKQVARKAQPIAQEYETVIGDLQQSEVYLHNLGETQVELEVALGRVKFKSVEHEVVYQRAVGTVGVCNEAREAALLAAPINQLRRRLQPGEPCSVCGAVHHPHADVVEPEGEELQQRTKSALAKAEAAVDAAQKEIQALKTEQAKIQADLRRTVDQIDICIDDITVLREERSEYLKTWGELYPEVADVSSDWVEVYIAEADAALVELAAAAQTQTEASSADALVSQQLKTYENEVARERESLRESEETLQNTKNTLEGLEADIASTEARFWERLPTAFQGLTPKKALNQFEKKIKAVEEYEDESRHAETQLQVLNTNIAADQNSLADLKKRYEALKAEIEAYQREGATLLNAAREKTDGLETEAKIDTAIAELETEVQSKERARNDVQQQLQNSGNLLTEKQTAHGIREKQWEECSEKFETARAAYFDKLADAGFESPEAHDTAFRDDAQTQALTDQIHAHEDEQQQLALDITELRTRFQETPFDPKALSRIETEVEEIGALIQTKREEIGAQRERITTLTSALERREALGDEIAAAGVELTRWRRLKETIQANTLRDFALEIMFKQMGKLANEQLRYLTSERYQLKVETIGDLSVIDRWNANEERPVETLSGGESFLTSLALALALADLSRGRAQLNSLFLDEGFGTLDAETLDTAIAALEGLRMQGRSIFLISHIQELTRRLPVKINVKKHGTDGLEGSFTSDIDVRG